MNTSHLLFSTVLILLLAACSAAQDQAPAPTAVPASPAEVLAPATAPPATSVPVAFVEPTAAAVPRVTSEPTAVPTIVPAPEIDPYALAREILEQSEFAAAEGWLVTPCEGEAAVLCISDGQDHVGYAELLIYPLSSYDADHPLRLAAAGLPPKPADYTVDHVTLARQALAALADEHLAVIAADRANTFPGDTFAPLGQETVQLGALPALAFGFVRTDEQGAVEERYANVAAFDQQLLYWLGINYLRGNESGFSSEAAIEQFMTVLYELATHLPVHLPLAAGDKSPPLLPPLTSYWEQNGKLPSDVTWVLAADLPRAAAAVDVLSQPAQSEPLTACSAVSAAATYGFYEPLYVEARTGMSVEETARLGLFVVFDGSRSLSLTTSTLYFYSDVANWHQGFDLPIAEAAPIAERFLQANGWLNFPYAVAESTQGEGVLFLPIIDGVQLLSPAYSVRVAGNGGVSSLFIHALKTLMPAHAYPIITAEEAWDALQGNRQGTAVFYRHVPPVIEASADAPQPIEYSNIPAAGEQGDVYTNIWAYRPLDADGPPVVMSSDFFRIRGGADLLNELAEQSDYLVHLWGTVVEPQAGLRELALSRWEVNKDAGGLPMFFGFIEQHDSETLLVDDANDATYVLPAAPQALAAGDYAAVSGLPETGGSKSRLIWQKITVYPQQPEAEPQPAAVPVQTVTIDTARLVYLHQHAGATGLDENLFIPAWEFAGLADGGTRVTVWVTAVKPEFFGS